MLDAKASGACSLPMRQATWTARLFAAVTASSRMTATCSLHRGAFGGVRLNWLAYVGCFFRSLVAVLALQRTNGDATVQQWYLQVEKFEKASYADCSLTLRLAKALVHVACVAALSMPFGCVCLARSSPSSGRF